MNAKLGTLLFSAVVVFSLSELFPPWLYNCKGFLHPAGYDFVTKPPAAADYVCPSSTPIPPVPTVLKNSGRLAAQRFTIIALAAGLLLITRRRLTKIGVVFACLVLLIAMAGLLFLGFMVYFGI